MKLIWTHGAVQDLTEIRDFIARDSEHYALAFVENALEVIEKLVDFPLMGRMVPEVRQENLRELIYGNYRIIYKIFPAYLAILTVIHGARNITPILKRKRK